MLRDVETLRVNMVANSAWKPSELSAKRVWLVFEKIPCRILAEYSHWRISLFSSVPPGKCRDSTLNFVTTASFHNLSNSQVIFIQSLYVPLNKLRAGLHFLDFSLHGMSKSVLWPIHLLFNRNGGFIPGGKAAGAPCWPLTATWWRG